MERHAERVCLVCMMHECICFDKVSVYERREDKLMGYDK